MKFCKTGKRIIAGITAAIYVVGAIIMLHRGDGPWAQIQFALASVSVVAAVTL